MSFLSILKKVGQVAFATEKIAAPLVSAFVPGAAPVVGLLDGVFTRLQTAITTVELQSPVGGGQVKADVVVADFEAGLDLTQAVLAIQKKKLVYDDAKLRDVIAKQVSALNAMAEFKATWKIEDV